MNDEIEIKQTWLVMANPIRNELKFLEIPIKLIASFQKMMLKIETPIKTKTQLVDAIRVYSSELGYEIDSTTERGETPKIAINLIKRSKTGKHEIEFVFLGGEETRHIEKLYTNKAKTKNWQSWGRIYFTPEQATSFAKFMLEIAHNHITNKKPIKTEKQGTL